MTLVRRRAVFLDRDGTLNVEVGYLDHSRRLRLLPGAGAGVRLLNRLGLLVIVTTNQAGVAHGHFNEATVKAINETLVSRLDKAGAKIDAVYYCPHHPAAAVANYQRECPFRKPAPGMLLQAARDLNIDLAGSYMVGDTARDVRTGRSAGARTVLVRTGYGLETLKSGIESDHVVKNLHEAAKLIENQESQVR